MSRSEKRSAARLAAVQALYEMEMSGKGVHRRRGRVRGPLDGPARSTASNSSRPRKPFFRDLVAGVVQEQRLVDQKVDAALAKGWPLKRVEAVLRAILRCGRL